MNGLVTLPKGLITLLTKDARLSQIMDNLKILQKLAGGRNTGSMQWSLNASYFVSR